MEAAEEFNVEPTENLDEKEGKKKRPIIKTAVDLQRLKVEKLMKNPDKLVIIPDNPKEKDFMLSVPTFVRNVMGSSAGAGSGEFHVYRHLRRKEYARQKYIQVKSIREQLDDQYHIKLEQNRLSAEEKTAKKRAKRLKKKQRNKKLKTNKGIAQDHDIESSGSDDDEESEQNLNKDNENVMQTESQEIEKFSNDVDQTDSAVDNSKELECNQSREVDISRIENKSVEKYLRSFF